LNASDEEAAGTASERWFDEYLVTNGYSFKTEDELGLGRRTNPDRLIERVGTKGLCEVKEFITDAMKRRWPEGGSRTGVFRRG
jgi:hypothetical protein